MYSILICLCVKYNFCLYGSHFGRHNSCICDALLAESMALQYFIKIRRYEFRNTFFKNKILRSVMHKHRPETFTESVKESKLLVIFYRLLLHDQFDFKWCVTRSKTWRLKIYTYLIHNSKIWSCNLIIGRLFSSIFSEENYHHQFEFLWTLLRVEPHLVMHLTLLPKYMFQNVIKQSRDLPINAFGT